MSDITGERHSRPRRRIAEIQIPGDVLVPRADFARDVVGVCERTIVRLNVPTTYIGGVAYVAKNAGLKIVASTVRRRNEPVRKRRR